MRCSGGGLLLEPRVAALLEERDPDGGIAPGTAFEDIPDDWFCPVCGARKTDFEPYEAGSEAKVKKVEPDVTTQDLAAKYPTYIVVDTKNGRASVCTTRKRPLPRDRQRCFTMMTLSSAAAGFAGRRNW